MTPQEQLDYERQLAEVMRIRKGGGADSSLFTWLNSTFVVTLLGIAGTGILGAWITGIVQDRSKRNEVELQARLELAKARNEAVSSILQLLGAFASSNDDLLVTVNNANSERDRSREDVEALRAWRKQIAAARDKADSDWQQQKGGWGFKLLYLYGNDTSVNGAWKAVAESADAFELCVHEWYTVNAAKGTDLRSDQICSDRRKALEAATAALTRAVAPSDSPYR